MLRPSVAVDDATTARLRAEARSGHRLEREHIHLILLDEAAQGWEDVEAGRFISTGELRAKYGR